MICIFHCHSVAGTLVCVLFFFFKHKTAYEMRISDWSSDVCSSDLRSVRSERPRKETGGYARRVPGTAGESNDPHAIIRQRPCAHDRRPCPCAGSPGRSDHAARKRRSHIARCAHAARSAADDAGRSRSEEHTSELQSLLRISYAVFCLQKKNI